MTAVPQSPMILIRAVLQIDDSHSWQNRPVVQNFQGEAYVL